MALEITATFYDAEGKFQHMYSFDMDEQIQRKRFAVECYRLHQMGWSIRTDALGRQDGEMRARPPRLIKHLESRTASFVDNIMRAIDNNPEMAAQLKKRLTGFDSQND